MTAARRALSCALIALATATLGVAQAPERPQGWYAEVETSLGSFTFRLLPDQAPQTVAHFVAFATGKMEFVDAFNGSKQKLPYYDGISIHKTVYGQRFEAGDRTGTGHGMPSVWVPAESGAVNFTRPYRVGMTGSTLKRNSGVLFFVTIVAEPSMNPRYNCFGEIIDGKDVIERICNVKTDQRRIPIEPVVIKHVAIVKSGNPDPLPEPVPYTPPVPVFGLTSDAKDAKP